MRNLRLTQVILVFLVISYSTLSGQIELKNNKIGVGTTTPTKDLHLASDEMIITDKSGANVRLVIDEDGKIGVGTSNPGSLIHLIREGSTSHLKTIAGAKSHSPYAHEFYLENSTTNIDNSTASIFLKAGRDQDGFRQNTARISAIRDGSYKTDLGIQLRHSDGRQYERLRIKSSGEVGIGMSNPLYKLDLYNIISGDLTDHNARFRKIHSSSTLTANRSHSGILVQNTENNQNGTYTNGSRLTSRGGYFSTLLNGTSNTYLAQGSYSQATFNGSAGVNVLHGSQSVANLAGGASGIVNSLIGSHSYASIPNYPAIVKNATAGHHYLLSNSRNTVNNAYGTHAYLYNYVNGNDIRNAFGTKSYILNNSTIDGTITNAYGLHAYINNNRATSHITNSIGVYSRIRNANTGTSQNAKLFHGRMEGKHGTEYGLYLDDVHVAGNGDHITMKHFIEGNVGLGTASPTQALDVVGNIAFNRNNVTADNDNGISWHSAGYRIHRTSGPWSAPNYQQLQLEWVTGIILNPGTRYGKSFVDIQGNGLRVTQGDVGIGTTDPLASLDVHGNLRLSSYTGTNYTGNPEYFLGVDESGNVIKYAANTNSAHTTINDDSSSKSKDNSDIDAVLLIVEEQGNLIKELSNRLLELEDQRDAVSNNIQISLQNSIELETPYISQNIPNPSRDQAIIKYYIPETASDATVKFFSMSGQVMREVDIDQNGQGQIDLDLTKMSTGSYMYALIVDGELIDTKTMVIVK